MGGPANGLPISLVAAQGHFRDQRQHMLAHHIYLKENIMRKFAFIALLALASPVLAAELTLETPMGTTMEEVKTTLTDMGYEVRKAEMEDGKIEVYFVKDGTKGEVYVDAVTGKIAKLDMK
jgi:hypothetical protein